MAGNPFAPHGPARTVFSLLRRVLPVVALAWSGPGSAAPEPHCPDTPFAEVRSHFVKAQAAHFSGELVLTEDSIASLTQNLACAAFRHATRNGLLALLHPGARLVIVPSGPHALNHLANRLANGPGATLEYDARFLFEHPYAAANFDKRDGRLRIGHDDVAALSDSGPVLLHELVHVEQWALLKRRQPSDHHGWIDGEITAPNELQLDEMLAYSHDMERAKAALADQLHDLTGEDLAFARLQQIFSARFSNGAPPSAPWSRLETLFDGVAKKTLHGLWHTEPALAVFASLPPDVQATYRLENGTLVVAHLTGLVGSQTFGLHLPLIESAGVNDAGNRELFRRQLERARAAAERHRHLWDATRAQLEACVAAREPQPLRRELERLVTSGGTPPGTARAR